MNKDILTNAKYEAEENSGMLVIKANPTFPQSLIVSCEKVTISVNALRLNVDFTTDQLKQLDIIEINGTVFEKVKE